MAWLTSRKVAGRTSRSNGREDSQSFAAYSLPRSPPAAGTCMPVKWAAKA